MYDFTTSPIKTPAVAPPTIHPPYRRRTSRDKRHAPSRISGRHLSPYTAGASHVAPLAFDHADNAPCAPNSNTKIKPAITGETENGKSITETSSDRPLNRNFVIDQA